MINIYIAATALLFSGTAFAAKATQNDCVLEGKSQGLREDELAVYAKICMREHAKKANDYDKTYSSPRAATDAELAAIRAAMQLELRDADSARFSNVMVRDAIGKPNDYHACGLVNAKNTYGAYEGFTAFEAFRLYSESPHLDMTNVMSLDNGLARMACLQWGMRLP